MYRIFIGQIGDPVLHSLTMKSPLSRRYVPPSHLRYVCLRFTITDLGVDGAARVDKVWFTIECSLDDPIWDGPPEAADNSRFHPQARAQLGPQRLVSPPVFGMHSEM